MVLDGTIYQTYEKRGSLGIIPQKYIWLWSSTLLNELFYKTKFCFTDISFYTCGELNTNFEWKHMYFKIGEKKN